eukprot:743569-Alexandrium_andersonii.AAC.1
MSDAEVAYRKGLSQAFGRKPLMCCFHVKAAVRKYLQKHAGGSAEDKRALTDTVLADVDAL